ncbi:MAG: type II secretion system protein GspD [Pirellulales bacterium]
MTRSLIAVGLVGCLVLAVAWAQESDQGPRRGDRGAGARPSAAAENARPTESGDAPRRVRPDAGPAMPRPVLDYALVPPAGMPPMMGGGFDSSNRLPVLPAGEGDRRNVRAVVRLRSAPAEQLVKTVSVLLRSEGAGGRNAAARSVVIVPDPIGNSLILSGAPDVVEEVRHLVDELDHPAVMVRLEVVIAEVPVEKAKAPAEAKAEGKAEAKDDGKETKRPADALAQLAQVPGEMEVVVRAQLTSLDGQQASLRVGQRQGRVTGTNLGRGGGMSNSIMMEDVGTSINLIPRVGEDGVVRMELMVEDSRLGPLDEGVVMGTSQDNQPIRAPNTQTSSTKTTLAVPDGKTVAAGGMSREPKSGKEWIVLVTPHVLRMGQ